MPDLYQHSPSLFLFFPSFEWEEDACALKRAGLLQDKEHSSVVAEPVVLLLRGLEVWLLSLPWPWGCENRAKERVLPP